MTRAQREAEEAAQILEEMGAPVDADEADMAAAQMLADARAEREAAREAERSRSRSRSRSEGSGVCMCGGKKKCACGKGLYPDKPSLTKRQLESELRALKAEIRADEEKYAHFYRIMMNVDMESRRYTEAKRQVDHYTREILDKQAQYKELRKKYTRPLEGIREVKGYGKKVRFVKKYLKGQGIHATKHNVDTICNVMDAEGIVFDRK
jgi:multidrug efflux pump subunit AcrA (membrane-fusion protein)